MLCSYCGATSGNAGFCTACGKTLEVAATIPPRGIDAIPKETPTPAESVVQPPPAPPIDQAQPPTARPASRRDPRKRNRVFPVVALSVAGLLFVGGAGLAVWWLYFESAGDSVSAGDEAPAGDYGSDSDLDDLWDDCAAGSLDACDELYLSAAAGTEYEDFGATCGDRGDGFGSCALLGGATVPVEDGSFGSDAALDLLWGECEAGSMVACDDLYLGSPVGSEYEEFGAACGGRGESNGDCAVRFP